MVEMHIGEYLNIDKKTFWQYAPTFRTVVDDHLTCKNDIIYGSHDIWPRLTYMMDEKCFFFLYMGSNIVESYIYTFEMLSQQVSITASRLRFEGLKDWRIES